MDIGPPGSDDDGDGQPGPTTPRLDKLGLEPEPEPELLPSARGSLVLDSEFGYDANSSPYTDKGSAWGHFSIEDGSGAQPDTGATLSAQLSGPLPSRCIVYMNPETRPQEHTTTAEELVGSLLRAGTVRDETVVWMPDYEQHLLVDVIDLDAAREAKDDELEEVLQMLLSQLRKLPRSSARSFPSRSDAASTQLPPFSVTIHEPGPLGISWTSRTNASPPEIERVGPGSIAARVPQLQRGMVLLSVQGESLHGLALVAMLASIDQHADRPLLLGFAEPAAGASDEEICVLAAGDVLAPAYRNLRSRSSHAVEIFRHAARELRLEEEQRFVSARDPRTATQMTLSRYEDTVVAVEIKTGTKLLVKADYRPSFDGAIPVQKGQEVVALDTRHAEWWAVDAGGRHGYVPKAFLDPLRSPFMCMVRLPKPYDHVETGLACHANTTAQQALDAALKRLKSLLNSGGSAPTEDMRRTMKTDAPATIPLDSAAYALKVAGFDDYVTGPGTRLVDAPTIRQQMRQRAGDSTWRLALHLVQLPEIARAACPSSSTVAAALQVAPLRSSSTPIELDTVARTGDIPGWWRDTADISSTLSVKVRAVLGIQPGDHASYEPAVDFPDGFWGSKLVSNVPIGDVYVECVIYCGNRVIGSPDTKTRPRGPQVEKQNKPSGTAPDPRYVFVRPPKLTVAFSKSSLHTNHYRVFGRTKISTPMLACLSCRGRPGWFSSCARCALSTKQAKVAR